MEEKPNTIGESEFLKVARSSQFRHFGLLGMRCLLGGLFIYAGFTKAMSFPELATTIRNFHILPDLLVEPLSFYLPLLEILVGAALIGGVFYPGALFLTTALLVFFSLALFLAWIRGLDIECGCFGRGTGSATVQMALLRNLLLLSICLVLKKSLTRKGFAKIEVSDG